MYPTTTSIIDNTYSFTQQPYGFVTSSSSGYKLIFYENQDFWFDKEIGSVKINCAGIERVTSEIRPGRDNYNRLLIKLDGVVIVDTTLTFKDNFNLLHRMHDYY